MIHGLLKSSPIRPFYSSTLTRFRCNQNQQDVIHVKLSLVLPWEGISTNNTRLNICLCNNNYRAYATYSGGTALEFLMQMAIETVADPWFTIPVLGIDYTNCCPSPLSIYPPATSILNFCISNG